MHGEIRIKFIGIYLCYLEVNMKFPAVTFPPEIRCIKVILNSLRQFTNTPQKH
jgi:hypothetical protein